MNIVNGVPGGTSYYGLNVITSSGTIVFTGVDDVAHPPVTDTSAYAEAKFNLNNNFPSDSVWRYSSSDPFAFKAVPEPASIAVWGLLAACIGLVAWRKRK